jgi:hypothetical protein
MSASDYLELKVLDHIFNKAAYTAPTNIFVALLTAAPADSATGSSGLTEATYTGYARKSTAAADWNAAAAGATTNANVITFAACTGGSSTVTHFALLDASSAGNVLFTGALSASLAVSNGITPSFAAGALSTSAD